MAQMIQQNSPAMVTGTDTVVFEQEVGKKIKFTGSRSRSSNKSLNLLMKRLFDMVFSVICLVMALPLFLLVAAAIKLTSKGPVFFRQERVGIQNSKFKIWKFRTMTVEDSKPEHQSFVKNLLNNDQENETDQLVDQYMSYIERRTTPIGIFLRESSLDELPQLLNIFKGDMSFVGPRPHPVYEVDEYKSWYRRRLDVKPGLTGWSKLNLRLTPKNYEESILYDLWYVDHWKFLLDIRIILMTVPFVLSRQDAH